MSHNQFYHEIFEDLEVYNQMSGTCGQYEPLNSPLNALFSCVKDRYFITFLFEHPVQVGHPPPKMEKIWKKIKIISSQNDF